MDKATIDAWVALMRDFWMIDPKITLHVNLVPNVEGAEIDMENNRYFDYHILIGDNYDTQRTYELLAHEVAHIVLSGFDQFVRDEDVKNEHFITQLEMATETLSRVFLAHHPTPPE